MNHAENDAVLCYSDEFHCFLQSEFIALGNMSIINPIWSGLLDVRYCPGGGGTYAPL